MSEKTILERAADHWGPEDRIMLLAEEAGELLAALNHWRRGRGSVARVAEELADLSIVADQIPYVIATGGPGPECGVSPEAFRNMVAGFRKQKLIRLEVMLGAAQEARQATLRMASFLEGQAHE